MTSRRMAPKPLLLLALLLVPTLAASTNDFQFHLTPEILTFVPPCARECFLSFLKVNYDNPCSSTTSLNCLCQKRGLSGFTVAEGLVQCIAAERAIEFCDEKDGGNERVAKAFEMCDGKEGAVKGTNSVFTATLIMPTSGPGVVRFPPIRTTTMESSSRYASGTRTSRIETETLIRDPEKTSSTFRTRTSSSTKAGETTSEATTSQLSTIEETTASSPTATPEYDKADEKDESSSLNTAQIAGLSTGLISVALIATLLILLARRYRKKRHSPSLSSYAPQSPKASFFRRLLSKGSSAWPYARNKDDDSGSLNGVARQVNDPLSPTGGFGAAAGAGASDAAGKQRGVNGAYGKGRAGLNEKPKRSSAEEAGYDWQSWWPAAIGVALSGDKERQTEKEAASRRHSKLLPAKPEFVPSAERKNSPGPMSPATFQGATMVAAVPKQSPRKSSPSKQQTPPRSTPPRNLVALRASPASPSPPPKAHLNTNKPQPPTPLTLAIPKNPPSGVNPLTRDSVFTQFEEDGSAIASTVPAGSQIWVPPSAGPDGGGGPFYYSDANGNWVLRSSSVNGKPNLGQRDGTREMTAEQQAGQMGLMPAAEIIRADSRSQASSIYSQQTPATIPRPLFSGPRRPNHNRRSSNPPPMPRRESDDSGVTQFSGHSSSSSDPTPPPILPPGSLSPVAESPPSARPGRGVVQGQREGANFRDRVEKGLMPPRAQRAYHPPGQPSPTLGMMSQSQDGPDQERGPQEDAVFSYPQPIERPQQPPSILKPSQPTLRLVRPSPEPESAPQDPFTREDESTTAPSQDRDMLPSSRRRVSFSPTSPTPSSYNTWRPPKPAQNQQPQRLRDQQQPSQPQHPSQHPRPHFRQPSGPYYQQDHHGGTYQTLQTNQPGPRSHPSHIQPQPHHRAPQQPRPYPGYPPSRNSLQNNPYAPPRTLNESSSNSSLSPFAPKLQSPAVTTPTTATTITSQTSGNSLLAKRIGASKAANMALANRPPSTQSKWKQFPMRGEEQGEGMYLHPSAQVGEGPKTPGMGRGQSWLPTLTPTRRGDDLYLNVQ